MKRLIRSIIRECLNHKSNKTILSKLKLQQFIFEQVRQVFNKVIYFYCFSKSKQNTFERASFGASFPPLFNLTPFFPSQQQINSFFDLPYYILFCWMEETERKDNRLLSGLIDLKVEHIGSDKVVEEGRRKSKKGNALRAIYDDHIYQNFLEIAQKKTTIDKAIILKSLKGHFTFSALIEEPDLKDLLLEKFKLCKVLEGQYLMKQGNSASSFFILHEGKLTVQINGVVKRHIEPGEGFGELALLYSAPRSASIKAVKSSFLWYIDRQTFRTALASMITKNYKENRLFIQKNPFFKYLTSSQKDRLASVAISQRFEKGKEICKEGELAASMYILKSGKLTKHKGNEYKGTILKGESFEEYTSLSKGCLRRTTIKVAEEAEVIALGVQDIENALGRSLPLIILRNQAKNALKASKVLEKLSEEYFQKLIDCFRLKNVKSGEVIVKKDDLCRNLIFFIAEGQYMISDSSRRAKLYGQSAFLDQNSTFRCQIKMKEPGKIAWTTLDEVVKAFGCSLQQAYKNSQTINKALEAQRNVKQSLSEMGKKLTLEDLLVVKKLGEGQFGHVFLVADPSKERFFALKTISKQQTIKSKLQKHLTNERQALSLISSPFVMQFVRSYKDDNYIYFLTEFINGIELFDAIRLIGLLSTEQTTFYAAQLLHIIEVMHQRSLIYRDLKPENVMLCADGYLKLIDLGTCKKLNGNEKTFTMIGTPNYMAPETLAGKGYSFPADLWSLGIILFEFMAGYVPYGEEAEDPLQIYQEILKNPLKFPKNMKDTNINGFISLLLCKNPQTRLGGSFSNLKKHLVFSQIQWHDIIGKNMKPLFMIPHEKLLDLANFKSKVSPLKEVLKPPNKVALTRKDYDPNWDSAF